jgi:hypothetical protein
LQEEGKDEDIIEIARKDDDFYELNDRKYAKGIDWSGEIGYLWSIIKGCNGYESWNKEKQEPM